MKRVCLQIVKHVVLLIITFFTVLPFWSSIWGLITALWGAVTGGSAGIAQFVSRINIWHQLGNSLVITASTVIVVLILSSVAAYGITRYRGLYFRSYSVLMLILQMFPSVLTLVTLFCMIVDWGLLNTHISLILVYSSVNLSFAILILCGGFDSIPADLEDAARIDGASRFHAFVRIIFPLALPYLVTAAIITFINAWNEYTFASIFIRNKDMMTMTQGMRRGGGGLTSVFGMLPCVIFLLFAQKYLLSGMTAGAVKG